MDIRNRMEEFVMNALEKIEKMPEGDDKNKAIKPIVDLYKVYSEDWKHEMDVKIQLDRLDLDKEIANSNKDVRITEMQIELQKLQNETKDRKHSKIVDIFKCTQPFVSVGATCLTTIVLYGLTMYLETQGCIPTKMLSVIAKLKLPVA